MRELPDDIRSFLDHVVCCSRITPCFALALGVWQAHDFPAHLPAALSKYVLHSFGKKCPPSNIAAEDVVPPRTSWSWTTFPSINWSVAVEGLWLSYSRHKAHWVGLSTPSWEREADLDMFRRKFLLYWDGKICQRVQGNRAYRVARPRAARRELARLRGERYFDYGYDPISCETWLRRFSSHPLLINARF